MFRRAGKLTLATLQLDTPPENGSYGALIRIEPGDLRDPQASELQQSFAKCQSCDPETVAIWRQWANDLLQKTPNLTAAIANTLRKIAQPA